MKGRGTLIKRVGTKNDDKIMMLLLNILKNLIEQINFIWLTTIDYSWSINQPTNQIRRKGTSIDINNERLRQMVRCQLGQSTWPNSILIAKFRSYSLVANRESATSKWGGITTISAILNKLSDVSRRLIHNKLYKTYLHMSNIQFNARDNIKAYM